MIKNNSLSEWPHELLDVANTFKEGCTMELKTNKEMKKLNKNLHAAKRNKNDEFYTQISDIEKELKHYKEHFKNKIVFCNCDDPEESDFWRYFSLNFEFLQLKKLIATHFETDKPSYKLEIVQDINNDGKINGLDTIKTVLKQNGDFRSPECIEILKEADIVVTNPPFSLFREYVTQLIEYEKKFIIVGSMNAITYKEIFPLLKDNKMWLGNNSIKEFLRPDGTIEKFGNVLWYTNLPHNKRNEELILFRTYKGNEESYPKYDNYDAIEVSKVVNIPIDYTGVMGVPITFLDKYNPNQFEIVGQGQGNLYRELTPKGLNQKFVDAYYNTGGTGSIKEDHPVLGYYSSEGKAIIPYMRILIRRK